MKETQWKKLHQAMSKGRRLTALDGFKICGTLNMWKRIQELEKHLDTHVSRGWKHVGGKRVREFFMKGRLR